MLKNTRALYYVIRFTCYLLILLPAALGVLYVHAFGVSVVQRDAWSMVPLFERWHSGTLQVSDLFVQHFEHKSTFPEIAMLLLGIVTKYNNVAEMYLIQICLLVMLIILFSVFRANVKSSLELFLFVPISLLIFSFRQHANMLFGYQINFAFVETFGGLTLFLLYVLGRTRFKKLSFVAALVSATVATYSIVVGLLVWLAGLLQLFISPLEKPKKSVFITLWGLVGFVVWVTYLWNWVPGRDCSSFIDWNQAWCQGEPSGQSPVLSLLLNAFEHPLAGIDFFLNLLASSLLWPQQRTFSGGLFGQYLGSVFGLLLLGFALVGLLLVCKSRRLGEYSFWVSLMFYAFLILMAITAAGFGWEAHLALAPRYTSFSILAVVSIYALLATMALKRGLSIRRPNISTILVVFLSGIVLLNAAISYPKGIKQGRHEKVRREEQAYILSTYESQPDELLSEISGIYNGAWVVRERAPILQRLGYNVFSEPQPYRPLKKYGREK